METWVAVAGYENLYEVSNLGQVRSLPRKSTSGKVLKAHPDKDGYLQVVLSKASKTKTFKVHRLVAATFIGQEPEGHQVSHKNGKNQDNKAENLEYATPKENCQLKTVHGTQLIGEKHNMARLTAKDVEQLREMRKAGYKYRELAAHFSISIGHVSDILNGRRWS